MVVAGCCRPAAAEPPTTILLHASDQASVPTDVLHRAEQEVVRIYRQVGVEVVWDAAMDTAATGDATVCRLFVIIVPPGMADGMAVNPTAMGVAITSSKTRGRLAYIFYNRIENIASGANADVAQVLGHAMAHEIGHLLLPAGHSATGLMRGDWNKDDLGEAVRGRLLFTAGQAMLIRTRLKIAD